MINLITLKKGCRIRLRMALVGHKMPVCQSKTSDLSILKFLKELVAASKNRNAKLI